MIYAIWLDGYSVRHLKNYQKKNTNIPLGKTNESSVSDPLAALFKSKNGTPDMIGVLKDMRDVLEDLKR